MQREIGTQVDIGKNVSAFESVGHVPSIDKTASDFEKADTKVKRLKHPSHPSYNDLETFDFQLLLDKNLYTNLNSAHFVFSNKTLKKSDINADTGADLIAVNNFFVHWIKEISITKYGTNKELTPTMTPQEICQYSDAMLKHLPAKFLKVIENDLLCSKEEVVIPYGLDKRWIGLTLDKDNQVMHNVIRSDGNKNILLKYIWDIGKINFPTKIDMKIRVMLENDMKKLFESDKNHTLGKILHLQCLTYNLYY